MSAKLIIKNHISSKETLDIQMTLGELRELVRLVETQNSADRLKPGEYCISSEVLQLFITVDGVDIIINYF